MRSVLKDDTGLSVSETVYRAPLTNPGEFLGSPELLPSSYLHKIDRAVAGFAVPPPHHVHLSPHFQLPSVLMSARYVFVCEDASVPSLAPLYRGPYLVLDQGTTFFGLQLGSRTDEISVDRVKPVISEDSVSAAFPPACGCCAIRPALCPALRDSKSFPHPLESSSPPPWPPVLGVHASFSCL